MLINFKSRGSIFLAIGIVLALLCIIYFALFYNRIIPKDKIVQSFDENYEKFESVKQYVENTEGDFYLNYRNGELTITNNGEALNIDNIPIKEQLIYLIHKLKVANIDEYEGKTNFAIYSGALYFEQGVVTFAEGTVQDYGSYGAYMEPIKDTWFYYSKEPIE